MKKKPPVSSFFGYVQNRGHVFVLSRLDAFEAAGEPDTTIFDLDLSKGGRSVSFVDWAATHLWADPANGFPVFIAGPEGKVAIKTAPSEAGMSEEEIWPGKQGPKSLGDIRDLRMIGKHLYAAGMGRQVYRREARCWMRADKGVVVAKPSLTDVVGFNSIDGTSEDDIYAAGFDGELWWWNGKEWGAMEGITNLVLNRVRVVAPNQVYVCGKMGMLIRGHKDIWDIVWHDATEDELWDVEVFNGVVYVTTEDCLYRVDGDVLEPVKTGFKKPSFGSLHANDGILLSVGRKLVCWTDDGKKWHDITP
jgi:hypothetical protein